MIWFTSGLDESEVVSIACSEVPLGVISEKMVDWEITSNFEQTEDDRRFETLLPAKC